MKRELRKGWKKNKGKGTSVGGRLVKKNKT